MKLVNGQYKTKAGSQLTVEGKHGGSYTVRFDWVEEPNACCDCRPSPYPELWDKDEWRIVWSCDVCGGGSAPVSKVRARRASAGRGERRAA